VLYIKERIDTVAA